MKKVIFLIVLLQVVCRVSPQDITISFQSKVSGISIDSIRATNLRTNQTLKLLGGESLLLVETPTGISPIVDITETGYIYPNPSNDDATFCFSTSNPQDIEIGLYNSSGQILKQNRQHLVQGTHRFELKFPVAGIYFVSVIKIEGTASFKAICTGSKIQTGSIQYKGSENSNSHKSDFNALKVATTGKSLAYTVGDVIHYSVSSGVNTTILTETPTISKAFDVEFVGCMDKEGKSYKVVRIGNQWWMAENLAYLPVVSLPSEGSITSPYYYVYDYANTNVATAKSTANYTTYGVLYNWPAALAACPPGWHLPSDTEWKQLEMALGMSQEEADKPGWRGTNQGTQMKTTSGWYYNGNGTNTSGFSGLPGGYRADPGYFGDVGYNGRWWSATETLTTGIWHRRLSHDAYGGSTVYRYDTNTNKEMGFSVRCVRD